MDPTGIGHEGLVVHVCRKGSGVVQLDESPIYNLSGLKPIEYLSAFYVEQDYTAAERFYKLAAKQVRELEALPACSLACVLPAATPQAMFCEGAYTCWLGLC